MERRPQVKSPHLQSHLASFCTLGVDEIVNEAPVQETGVVELETLDDAGNPVTGQCYTLTGAAGSFGPFCDNGEGDAAGEPGLIVVPDLPIGTYEAVLQASPETPAVEAEQQTRPRRSVSVRRGDRPTRVRFSLRAQQNQRHVVEGVQLAIERVASQVGSVFRHLGGVGVS